MLAKNRNFLRLTAPVLGVFAAVALFHQTIHAESLKSSGHEWCGTTAIEANWLAQKRVANPTACTPEGPCDDPTERDSFAPGVGTPTFTIQLYIHVFRNDDGSNPAASATDVANQMIQLNADYAPSGIQFEYQWNYVNSSLYRDLLDAEEVPMKTANAVKPDSFLNVYVVSLASVGLLGYAYTPWQPNSKQTSGGCVVTDVQHGGFGAGAKTMTHEIGHNLGLHHTQRGVSEVTQCSACYESPGASDNDFRGDFCSDTRPTPTNFNCSDPAGGSPCNGQPWAPTSFHNYMGYADDICYTNFSPQQQGRMRCWITDKLLSWTRGVSFAATPTFGPAPLMVNFSGQSSLSVSSWSWDFGDGNLGGVQAPSHIYTVGGTYDVSMTAQTTGGPMSISKNDVAYVYADTLFGDTMVVTPNQVFTLYINADNKCPLTSLLIPFTWAGPLGLTLQNYSVAGTRASTGTVSLVSSNAGSKINVVSVQMPNGSPLPVGSGPVLKLTMKAPFLQLAGANQIAITSLLLSDPTHTTIPGSYAPVTRNGVVTMGCCKNMVGNVDNDPQDQTDIADLTRLVDFLFLTFTPLACTAEANCDGDPGNTVDIADLTALVDFLFVSFAPLPACS